MEKLPRIPSPPGTAWREFRINVVPLLTFVVVLGATVLTWQNYVGPSPIVGEAEAVRIIVSSPQNGYIRNVYAKHLDPVSPSDTNLVEVLTTDPKLIQANLELIRARIELAKIIVSPVLRQENNALTYYRLRLDWLEHRTELAQTEVRLKYYESALDRVERFYNESTNQFISPLDLDTARRDVEVTRAAREQLSKLVKDVEETMMAVAPSPESIAEQGRSTMVAALQVQTRELELVQKQMDPVPLGSSRAGVVSVIHRHKGESVLAGEPILTISSLEAERIICFARQPLRFKPIVGMEMEVRSRSFDRKSGRAKIVNVGTQMEAIRPELLSNLPNRGSEYGLPIDVEIPPGMKLIPGELVDIRPVD